MKVYVVLEDDRGCGPMVVGVYQDKDRAVAVAGTSGHYWWVEEDVVMEADCTAQAEPFNDNDSNEVRNLMAMGR